MYLGKIETNFTLVPDLSDGQQQGRSQEAAGPKINSEG